MDKIHVSLNIVVANTFVMAFKAQSFHWNAEGKRFHMLHNFFGEIYEELFEAVDVLAENVRMLGQYAPYSIADLLKHSTIEEEKELINDCNDQIEYLIEANKEVLSSLSTCLLLANKSDEQGLVDLLGSRIAIHKKFGWMLDATNKED